VSTVAYNAALWAVEAIHIYQGTIPVTLDFTRQQSNVIPGVALNFFDQARLAKLKTTFFDRQNTDRFSILNNEDCLFSKFAGRMNNTALKPDIKSDELDLHHFFQRLREKRDSLQHIYPSRIIPHNPGSDVGLANLVGQLKDFHERSFPGKYLPLKADTNIFMRIMQVCVFVVRNCLFSQRSSHRCCNHVHFCPFIPLRNFKCLIICLQCECANRFCFLRHCKLRIIDNSSFLCWGCGIR
jgi:hypothetical protein